MSVKLALLALLSRGPSTAYDLKKDFDATVGQSWPLNIGQVSTTLQRLERDGLVEHAAPGVGIPGHPSGPAPWRLTTVGTGAVAQWWDSPVPREQAPRDELVIKLTLAVVVPGVDVVGLVQRQRSALQQDLHDVTRARHTVPAQDINALLVLDHHIFATEAELRWLDSVEGTLVRAGRASAQWEPQSGGDLVRPVRHQEHGEPCTAVDGSDGGPRRATFVAEQSTGPFEGPRR